MPLQVWKYHGMEARIVPAENDWHMTIGRIGSGFVDEVVALQKQVGLSGI